MKNKSLIALLLVVVAFTCLLGACSHTHEFGNWVVTKQATCTEDGQQTRTCKCGEKETQPISALGHDEETHQAQVATCQGVGWQSYVTCKREGCDYSTYSEIAATGHTAGQWIIDVEATCTTEGSKHQVCVTCGETLKTEKIPVVAHSFSAWMVVEASTCAKQGYEERSCSCGESETRELALKNHTMSWITDKEPTYVETGLMHQECSVCGVKQSENTIIPVKTHEHNYVLTETINPTCTQNGEETFTCTICQDTYTNDIDALGHSYQTAVTDPTCTEQGYSTHTCSVCGDNYKDNYVEANGVHDFQEADTCVYCAENIENVAVETYNMSATAEDNVRGYVVPRADGLYDAYIKGTGAMKDYTSSNTSFHVDGYSIKKAYIGNGVTSIGGYAFYNCRKCTNIIIPDSATSIGSGAFYNCSSLTSITIPDSVTSIGEAAFDYCSSLTSVTIGNSVTSIGSSAFWGCSSLKSITIPDSVTSIGEYAFYNCSSLTSITIPDSVTSIGSYAFRDCSSLTSITIPDSVTFIGNNAFSNTKYYNTTDNWQNKVLYIDNCLIDAKTTIEECVVNDGTTIIANNAFYGCSSLTNITIPDSVTSIGDYAFYNCSSITSITIPERVTSIGGYAFYNCRRCTNIIIPDSVTSIGNYAFCGCSSLTSITIPNSVTSIGYRAFHNCSSLISITIPFVGATLTGTSNTHFGHIFGASSYLYNDDYVPSSLKSVVITGGSSIGNRAFYGCKDLTNITIPDSVTSIDSYAFYNCSSLTSITIPDSVTSIGSDAFYNCSSLTSVTIGYSVTSMGDYAFYNCSTLTNITIPFVGETLNGTSNTHFGYIFGASSSSSNSSYVPSSLKSVVITGGSSIGNRAFYGCKDLTNITIPDSVTSIGEDAFLNCSSLTSITIPDSVTSIGSEAFYDCYKLVEVVNKSSSITVTRGSSANGYVGYYALAVYNPGDTYETHFSNDNGYIVYTDGQEKILVSYAGVETELILPSYITKINGYAFYRCISLTSITIPDSVTSIGSYAFRYCSSLTSITIPDGVISIGSYAFRYCSSLTSITIPDSVTSIGSGAFFNCKGLTSITIPDSVTSIGNGAFYGCSSLTSITIPDGVTSIGTSAFNGCSSLTSITIPDSVTSIGDYAFRDCSSLTSITIPDSVTSIGWAAFEDCSSLTSITIPDSVTSIGCSAFDYCSSLSNVYYTGTQEQWKVISISSSNTYLTDANRYYYSETQPATSGNYWHYVDGVPTKW